MQQLMEFATNNPVMSLAWVGLLVALIFTTVQQMSNKVKKLTPHQVTLLINREDAQVVDIRSQEEFKKGHILGAANISLTDLQNNALGGLEKKQDKPIIVVCATGTTAGKGASALKKAGFTAINMLKGGMTEWTGAKLPVSKKK